MIFATNRGEAARIAGEPPGGDPDTLVVWDGSRRLVRSSAVLAMLRTLGGGWWLLAALTGLCPLGWRDFLYHQVARRRLRFAGPDACTRLSPHHLAE
jgi:predicted DCC family thiol-disulfide oxidoreductase YuxK